MPETEHEQPWAFQHLNATNDTNGNPRRVYVIYSRGGDILAAYDEGYRGKPAACQGLAQLPGFRIMPGAYRDLLRQYGRAHG